MKQYIFDHWYLTETNCKNIKEKFEGKSYMHFHISWSNEAGNCTLIVGTDYEESEEYIKDFFLFCVITSLTD